MNTLLTDTQDKLGRALGHARTRHGGVVAMFREIEEATQGLVTVWWLQKFTRGVIPNPGVLTVQALHDWLAQREAAEKQAAA